MFFPNLDEIPSRELMPGIVARTFWGDQMLCAIVDLAANSNLPLHSHPHEQAGVVLQGELELTVAGETKLLVPGDTYLVPGNVEHSARTGNMPTRVMDIFSPVREEYKHP